MTYAVQTRVVLAGVCNLHCKWKLLYRDLVKCDKDSNNVSERGVVIFSTLTSCGDIFDRYQTAGVSDAGQRRKDPKCY